MSEFASLEQRRPGHGPTRRPTVRAVLREQARSHARTDTVGHENDSWAGVAIGWFGGEP
ncbi:hypothetical protein [Nocardiopsis kunsanensis]|uniref:hypothetical protein n=1 Tax=Nocardiopsis kunsanensis TaxID=141693 RepID=UPI000347F227|nr:hypothetical protein [Nocardiopsis kunsanensis]